MTHRRERGRPAHPDILTPGEWRVAEGVRHGMTNPQIARRQGISRDAVKFHVSNILLKLGMDSRAELKRWAGVDATSALARSEAMSDHRFGAIGQIARTVSNIEAARRWYRDVLGLPHLFDAGNMAFFDCGGTRLMLVEGAAGPESILYFRTGDLHGAFERLAALRARIVSAPHRIHTHDDGTEEWIGFIEDEDARPLALMTSLPAT